MGITVTTYTAARANLKKLMDEAVSSREAVIIQRRTGGDVALIAADELSSLLETAHLLRSPRNASRLLHALERARAGGGRRTSLKRLRQDMGIDGGKR